MSKPDVQRMSADQQEEMLEDMKMGNPYNYMNQKISRMAFDIPVEDVSNGEITYGVEPQFRSQVPPPPANFFDEEGDDAFDTFAYSTKGKQQHPSIPAIVLGEGETTIEGVHQLPQCNAPGADQGLCFRPALHKRPEGRDIFNEETGKPPKAHPAGKTLPMRADLGDKAPDCDGQYTRLPTPVVVIIVVLVIAAIVLIVYFVVRRNVTAKEADAEVVMTGGGDPDKAVESMWGVLE